MASWIIRTAGVEDCAALASLNEYAQAPHVAARPDIFKPAAREELEAWYRALLNTATTRAWLCELEHEPAGYVLALLRETADNPFCLGRRWLELDQIAVATVHRRRGIARALSERVLTYAREEGLPSVELNSWSFNSAAHAAFAQLGFAPQRARFERRP